jgi:hypothetical protein
MNPARDSVDDDALARRLAVLGVEGDEHVLDLTLAVYRARLGTSPRRRWLQGGSFVAAVVVFLVVGSVIVAATSFGDVILRFAGLAPNDAGRIQLVVGSATSSGQTVQVVGAYADATRTVVFVHTSAAGPVWATLTTDWGQQLSGPSQAWERSGEGALAFGPIANPRPEGDRVTLKVLSLQVRGGPLAPNGNTVRGEWEIRFSVKASVDSVVPTPTSGKLGRLDVVFKIAGGSGDSVYVSFETLGATSDELQPAYCTAYGWCSDGRLRIQMFDPTGTELKILQSAGGLAHLPDKVAPPEVWAREAMHVRFDTYWTASGPGTYRLVLSYEGQRLASTFAVR